MTRHRWVFGPGRRFSSTKVARCPGAGSTVNILGGTVGNNFEAVDAAVTITGGNVGRHFDAFAGSTINIRGGNVGAYFSALAGSTVNVFGSDFQLNGDPIGGLQEPGDSIVLDARSDSLVAKLADGDDLTFDTNDRSFRRDFFHRGATLRLHLVRPVPEPSCLVLLLVGTLLSRRVLKRAPCYGR